MVVSAESAVRGEGIADKAAVCGACHGGAGMPANRAIPIIWGQNEDYLLLQLRDFALGTRANAAMTQIARGLERQDMKALAGWFAAKSWPDLRQSGAAETAPRAETLVDAANCMACHQRTWQGDGVVPRIGGQGLPYLRATLAAFRDGTRANNPGMAALTRAWSDSDLDRVASYLAGH
jgi:cytochrome c553